MSKITFDDPDTKKAAELYQSGGTLQAAAEAANITVNGLKPFQKAGNSTAEQEQAVIAGAGRKNQAGTARWENVQATGQEYRVSYGSTRKYAADIDPGCVTRGRKSTITLDDPVNQKAVEIYKSGASLKTTAAAVFMSEAGLRYRFKALGIPLRPKSRQTPPEIVEAMRREYIPGKITCAKLAKKYGVSDATVQKYVKGRK